MLSKTPILLTQTHEENNPFYSLSGSIPPRLRRHSFMLKGKSQQSIFVTELSNGFTGIRCSLLSADSLKEKTLQNLDQDTKGATQSGEEQTSEP